ncbi:hydroxyisourate hydrolase [Kocuria rhizophila]|nr:hydroxyisourate hydrolase [Kocuria rhizophila]
MSFIPRLRPLRRTAAPPPGSTSPSSPARAAQLASATTDEDGRALERARPELAVRPLPDHLRDLSRTSPAAGWRRSTRLSRWTSRRVRSRRHYHVPVLLSPFAHSTYRGS